MYTAERQRAHPYLAHIAGPLIEQWYLLHHRIVRVVTNHASLAEYTRNFLYYAEILAEYHYEHHSHLPVSIPEELLWQTGQRVYKPVALTCYLFEPQAGTPFPPAPCEARPEEVAWEEISGVDGPLRARWKKDKRRFREYQSYPGVTSRISSMLDKEDLLATIFIEQVQACKAWFIMRFVFYMIVGAMLSYDGYEVVHAGAIALDSLGTLIVGAPGSGKSTLILACLQAGMQHLADDVLFLAKDDDLVHVYAFPEDIGMRSGGLELLGAHESTRMLMNDERQKRFIDVQQHFRGQVINSSLIQVMLFVSEKHRAEQFRAEPLFPVQAATFLMQEYISQQRAQESDVDHIFRLFTDLAQQTVSYRLWLSPNPQENARQVRILLEMYKA